MIDFSSDSDKYPIYHALIVLFLSVGLCGIPIDFIFSGIENGKIVYWLSEGIKRIIIGCVAVVFIAKYGFIKQLKNRVDFKSFCLMLPAFLIVINNFPIIGVIGGNVTLEYTTAELIIFLSYCVSIAFFEETVFRGILLPLCIKKLRGKNHFVFWAIALSSAMFALTHLLNILGGGGIIPTLLQVGYSFLIGSMCAIALVKTKNIVIPIILHTVFDVGGLLTGEYGIAHGNQWDIITVLITAVLSVAVICYMVFTALKFSEREIESLY